MKPNNFKMVISPKGEIQFIYDDLHASFIEKHGGVVSRASHVEPCTGGWQADMSPVGGPVLGPYPLRQTALDEEVKWLQAKLFT